MILILLNLKNNQTNKNLERSVETLRKLCKTIENIRDFSKHLKNF